MNIGPEGLALIKKFEGCKLKTYSCSAGRLTIGYGNTFYEDGSLVEAGDVISQERAEELLLIILKTFVLGVNNSVTKELKQTQFDALVAFAYNVGLGNFKTSTLLKKVNLNPDDITIGAQFLRWNKVKGVVVKGLTNRRTAEKELYEK